MRSQMTIWTRDKHSGSVICGVCGEIKNNETECCKTAPWISFNKFKSKYFNDQKVNNFTAQNFHEDYLLSKCESLDQYIKETVSHKIDES